MGCVLVDPRPITRQRSKWDQTGTFPLPAGVTGKVFKRAVGDGMLTAIVSQEPQGWHMSISHRFSGSKREPAGRYPHWDEIAHARDSLLPADVAFVMHLPTEDEYVAIHDTCFHIHEYPEVSK